MSAKPTVATDRQSLAYTKETFPIKECIREVNDSTWIIAGTILLTRQRSESPSPSWSDGEGGFYVVTDATEPLPPSQSLPKDRFQLVYDVGESHVAWVIGEAVLKASIWPWEVPRATREHVTLNWLREKPALSFGIPRVLYNNEFDGRYYIFLDKIPGQTLGQAWATMDEDKKQGCVDRIVEICGELAQWQGSTLCGVDGGHLPEYYLFPRGKPQENNPEALMRSSVELGMDCSTLVFTHCDLGPGNIFVDAAGKISTIIDWEIAGFLPKEWVRTKFRLSPGFDLPDTQGEEAREWRTRVARRMGEAGFNEVVDGWMAWRKAGSQSNGGKN